MLDICVGVSCPRHHDGEYYTDVAVLICLFAPPVRFMAMLFDGMDRSNECHIIPKYGNTINQVLIDCSGPPNEPRNEETGLARKRDALLSQLERRMALRTLVFCNTIQGCRQASFAVDSIYYKAIDRSVKMFHVFGELWSLMQRGLTDSC